ncbi:MAG: phage tail protein [Acidobacteria bacterium]|nr:MAG: phage tail protein [Acidobacteriota bacterium]
MIPFGALGSRHDPPLTHNFVISLVDTTSAIGMALDLAGLALAGGFSECSGLEMAMAPEEYKEGGRNGGNLKFPSRVTWTNLTLKKGAALSTELWNWHYGFVIGNGRRRDGVIALLNEAQTPTLVWFFRRGLPVKYTGPALNAAQNTVAIEAIEIAHEGLHQVPGFGVAAGAGVLAGLLG